MIDKRYGRLIILEQSGKNKWGEKLAVCKCDCGTIRTIRIKSLKKGDTKSCGCFARETRRKRKLTHGRSKTYLYFVWRNMINRCKWEKSNSYKDYGGRGITICKRWGNFENFLKDMGDRPTTKHTLDRIDNNGDYSPENCRWATRKEQMNNTRRSRFLTFQGETHTVDEWSEITGIKYSTLAMRLKKDWPIDLVFKKGDTP